MKIGFFHWKSTGQVPAGPLHSGLPDHNRHLHLRLAPLPGSRFYSQWRLFFGGSWFLLSAIWLFWWQPFSFGANCFFSARYFLAFLFCLCQFLWFPVFFLFCLCQFCLACSCTTLPQARAATLTLTSSTIIRTSGRKFFKTNTKEDENSWWCNCVPILWSSPMDILELGSWSDEKRRSLFLGSCNSRQASIRLLWPFVHLTIPSLLQKLFLLQCLWGESV